MQFEHFSKEIDSLQKEKLEIEAKIKEILVLNNNSEEIINENNINRYKREINKFNLLISENVVCKPILNRKK